jgi:hypothetical protein
VNSNMTNDPNTGRRLNKRSREGGGVCFSLPNCVPRADSLNEFGFWIVKSLRIDKAEFLASVARRYEPRNGCLALQYIVDLLNCVEAS